MESIESILDVILPEGARNYAGQLVMLDLVERPRKPRPVRRAPVPAARSPIIPFVAIKQRLEQREQRKAARLYRQVRELVG